MLEEGEREKRERERERVKSGRMWKERAIMIGPFKFQNKIEKEFPFCPLKMISFDILLSLKKFCP